VAIEPEDFSLLQSYRKQFSDGNVCAILGDCAINGNFDVLGFSEVETFDINGNPTNKLNLNEPIPSEFHNKYDWVIDSGTLYCCFNIAMVLENITNMLKDNGCVFHTSNLSGFYGRGYYSISPALYYEFYKSNGFNIHGMGTKTRKSRKWESINVGDTYLEYADSFSLGFKNSAGEFIETIPNDSLLYCFSSRDHKMNYTEPIPEHFTRTNGS
tara:strand:+ start:3722 stop:4360 length:639 start_codon:yes stop_codon:yes gene_type:complete